MIYYSNYFLKTENIKAQDLRAGTSFSSFCPQLSTLLSENRYSIFTKYTLSVELNQTDTRKRVNMNIYIYTCQHVHVYHT